eukprot:scaffold68423_cov73-Phaeocystis_antarctica.AAC.1
MNPEVSDYLYQNNPLPRCFFYAYGIQRVLRYCCTPTRYSPPAPVPPSAARCTLASCSAKRRTTRHTKSLNTPGGSTAACCCGAPLVAPLRCSSGVAWWTKYQLSSAKKEGKYFWNQNSPISHGFTSSMARGRSGKAA